MRTGLATVTAVNGVRISSGRPFEGTCAPLLASSRGPARLLDVASRWEDLLVDEGRGRSACHGAIAIWSLASVPSWPPRIRVSEGLTQSHAAGVSRKDRSHAQSQRWGPGR
jgi:hypothetical protein